MGPAFCCPLAVAADRVDWGTLEATRLPFAASHPAAPS